jgi:hypothetical protein
MLYENHALGRHAVEVGRTNILLAVTAKVTVAKIVGHDVDNVRACRTAGAA